MGEAYFARADELGCPETEETRSESEQICVMFFDEECGATPESIDEADHIIENWIGTKQDCESLQSLQSDLQTSILELRAAPCAGEEPSDGDQSADGDEPEDGDRETDGEGTPADGEGSQGRTVGEVCQELAEKFCGISIEMACIEEDLPTCVQAVFESGELKVGSTVCSDAEDATTADEAFLGKAAQLSGLMDLAPSCAALGYD